MYVTDMARSKKEEKVELFAENICEIRGGGSGPYVLRWDEVEVTRRKRAKSSKDRGELLDHSEKLKKRIYSGPKSSDSSNKSDGRINLPRLPKFGDASFFREALGAAVEAARQATCCGDDKGLTYISAYTRILSDVARSYQHYDQSIQTEEELKKLIEFHESTRKIVSKEGSNAGDIENIADTLDGGIEELM